MVLTDGTSAILAILGGLWVAVGLVMKLTVMTNERRDAVITGYLAGCCLTKSHRHLILTNDWLPMNAIQCYICLVLGAVLFLLPVIIQADQFVSGLCYAVVLIPGLACVSYALGGISEYKSMKNTLEALNIEKLVDVSVKQEKRSYDCIVTVQPSGETVAALTSSA